MADKKLARDIQWAIEAIENPRPRNAAWKRYAACGPVFAETGEDWWYGPELAYGEGTQIPKPIADKARQVCRRCPVRAMCLMEAIETGEEDGIWGGLTPYQRTRTTRRIAAKAA